MLVTICMHCWSVRESDGVDVWVGRCANQGAMGWMCGWGGVQVSEGVDVWVGRCANQRAVGWMCGWVGVQIRAMGWTCGWVGVQIREQWGGHIGVSDGVDVWVGRCAGQ